MTLSDRGQSALLAAAERVRHIVENDQENLDLFDPTQEGGGDPCAACGRKQDPWRYSRFCQACLWDGSHMFVEIAESAAREASDA